MDVDLDLDDLGPSKAPTRTSKFAPKSSKFKPIPKPKPETVTVSETKSEDHFAIPIPIPIEEFDDSKPPPPADDSAAKTENEQPANINGAVKMDIDASPGDEVEPEQEEEDQVVREIDVFFTPSIDSNTQLYVLQYPLRQCWRPYELDERCEEVRVKPTSAEIEVDLSIDVDTHNFDPDADDTVRMKKQVLSSSWKPPLTTGYAVGVLMGNKLHLNPVHAVVQLRPSMQHFKSGGSWKDMIESKELEDEKVVGPSKKQNKSARAANEQMEDTRESWMPLKYHGAKTDFSAQYMQRMVAQEGSHIHFSMSPFDYINSLCPGTSNDKLKSKGSSRSLLLSMPLEDRYKTWLLEGPPVHRFDALKHLAPNVSDEDILGVLKKHAQLVQGLWAPKSSLLYGKDGGLEALVRDYALLQFSKNPVYREVQLPKAKLRDLLKEILNVFAVYRHTFKDWKFKEPPDMSFIKLYPNIVKEQEQAWARMEKQIIEVIFGNNSSKHNMVKMPVKSVNTKEGAAKASNKQPSRTPMSDETREALPKALQKLFQIHKVCSFNQICQRLREMAVSESSRPKGVAREAIAAAHGVEAPQEELLAIINQVAINIHGVFVSKSSPDHPQYDGLRKIVIDLLLAEGPNGKLKKAAITAAAQMQLKREITPIEYQKVLNELCISQNSAWVLRKGDGNPK